MTTEHKMSWWSYHVETLSEAIDGSVCAATKEEVVAHIRQQPAMKWPLTIDIWPAFRPPKNAGEPTIRFHDSRPKSFD